MLMLFLATRGVRRTSVKLAYLLILAAIFLRCTDFAAGEIIQDQYYPGNDGSFNLIESAFQRAQTFPVTVAGLLDQVDVYVNDSNATGENLLWDIRPVIAGAPLSSDASVLASGTILAADIPVYPAIPLTTLDLSAFDIKVYPGEMLAVTLRTNGDQGFGWRGTFFTNPGAKFERTGNNLTWQPDTFYPSRPLGFATYIQTVPEPAGVALLLAGGLCLLGCRLLERRGGRFSGSTVRPHREMPENGSRG